MRHTKGKEIKAHQYKKKKKNQQITKDDSKRGGKEYRNYKIVRKQ